MTVLPLCACGCGQPVKTRRNRWATPGCVPRSERATWCRKGRKTHAYRRRARIFQQELAQLGPRFTREDLLVVFQRIYKRGLGAARAERYRDRLARTA